MSKKKLKRLLNRLQEQIEMTDALNSALFDLKCLLVDDANKKVEALFPNVTIDPDTLICDLQKQGLNTKPLERSAFDQPQIKPGDVCEVVGASGCNHAFAIGSEVEVTSKYESLPEKYECTGRHRTVDTKISQTVYAKDLKLKQ